MARPRKLPSTAELVRLVKQGYTHAQIAEMNNCTRSAASTDLSAAGETDRLRYLKHVPWHVMKEHQRNYELLMLRVHSRIEQDDPELTDELRHRHALWLARLNDMRAVVHYDPDSPDGFYWVARRSGVDLGVYEPDERPKGVRKRDWDERRRPYPDLHERAKVGEATKEWDFGNKSLEPADN